MTEEPKKTKQTPAAARGQLFGLFAAQTLRNQNQNQCQGAQGTGVQGAIPARTPAQPVFDSFFVLADQVRMRFRGQTGFEPGRLSQRRADLRSARLSALNTSKAVMLDSEPEPEQKPPAAPPPQPSFRCPWQNCSFVSNDSGAFQSHVAEHTRFHPQSY
jgi:hypothetical protein